MTPVVLPKVFGRPDTLSLGCNRFNVLTAQTCAFSRKHNHSQELLAKSGTIFQFITSRSAPYISETQHE